MLHAKFQDHGTFGSGEDFFYINLRSPFPRMFHIKFGFDWPRGFRGDV